MVKTYEELKQEKLKSLKKLPEPVYKVNWFTHRIEESLKDLCAYYGKLNLNVVFS